MLLPNYTRALKYLASRRFPTLGLEVQRSSLSAVSRSIPDLADLKQVAKNLPPLFARRAACGGEYRKFLVKLEFDARDCAMIRTYSSWKESFGPNHVSVAYSSLGPRINDEFKRACYATVMLRVYSKALENSLWFKFLFSRLFFGLLP